MDCFGVADNGQLSGGENDVLPTRRAGFALAEEENDLGLERIGILKLVHEDVVEHSLELGPHVAVVYEEVAQLEEQVELVELPVAALTFS